MPALDQAKALLATGNAVGAFPEGTVNRAWHAMMMTEIARLSGKTWQGAADIAEPASFEV